MPEDTEGPAGAALPSQPPNVGSPPAQDDFGGIVGDFLSAAGGHISTVVQPAAAAAVAASFSFPLALMLAVIAFLVVQSRIDSRDPKLRAAPQTVAETVVRFRERAEL